MPGFFGVINLNPSDHKIIFPDTDFEDQIEFSTQDVSISLFRETHRKFHLDKVFYEDADLIIILEGIILNKRSLQAMFGGSWAETVAGMYNKYGAVFQRQMEGSFSGMILDKAKGECIVFNDPIGDKQVFYCCNREVILFGSEIRWFLSFFQKNALAWSLDEEAAYMLLSYGFLLEGFTLFKEIRKLTPGSYLKINGAVSSVVRYYRFDNKPEASWTNENEIIEGIDERFRAAVKKQFDKDLEYNYRHLVGLSGGLDSRITTYVAYELGYKNIVNFTFSQSDYLDETTAKKIASDLKHEWIFKSLDNGTFLMRMLEDTIQFSYGGALYYGLAHSKSCLDLINMSDFGLVHTGQLGDVVIGTFFKNSQEVEKRVDYRSGAYSQMLLDKLSPAVRDAALQYQNNELYQFYSRGFNGANQGLLVAQQYTETFSPFYDLDLFTYCLKIPVHLRLHHDIYIKWIKKKYPGAAKYHWESIGGTVFAPSLVLKGRRYYWPQVKKRALDKFFSVFLRKSRSGIDTRHHMNPLNYWYNTNGELKLFLDDAYNANIGRLEKYPELMKDAQRLYRTGSSLEKNQVITLLTTMKLFFNNVP